jgi:hypothetical protein
MRQFGYDGCSSDSICTNLMNDQRATVVPLAIVGLLLLMPALYVGSYLALVVRAPSMLRNTDNKFEYVEGYRLGDDAARAFYRPLNGADRHLRPSYWICELR